MNTNLPHLVYDNMKVQQLSDITLPESLQPYEDAATFIWSQLDEETEIKLIELIDNKKVSLDFVLKTIYRASTKNPKHVNLLSDLYSKISIRYDSPIIWTPPLVPPENRSKKIYEDDQLFNLVAYDRLEEFKEFISKSPFDVNQTNIDLSLIECACKYGSVDIFRYLLMNGGKIDDTLPKYAVEGGSSEIISLLRQKDCKFGDCIRIAVINHHNDIVDWIITHYDFTALTVAECLM
ncbi:hypothetical protein TVAG_158120 [Trichomonas vaginalis G3]|uniref:DUF3447 domain-containing protein n=1 Tax=Trichomonas vaginalis (strain ATCC PRA-98 / G3) TaxID=412133 RepID=A2F9R0_TRIV3|nr:spectrin binding [Trichomonas vaginalis G3]EAX98352.1 hypothetical protein TVAG_158120 [Trichomonas vaginalis G3]KAI5495230.1 spectrin binding [Trichomonas vaginalis G3]|eukprot:XP_001311282.1 hypothetical protein [Trichomonas vaginalis G3]